MIIFIDESGIHKSVDHSVFAMAYIEFKNIEATERGVVDIEKRHKITAQLVGGQVDE